MLVGGGPFWALHSDDDDQKGATPITSWLSTTSWPGSVFGTLGYGKLLLAVTSISRRRRNLRHSGAFGVDRFY